MERLWLNRLAPRGSARAALLAGAIGVSMTFTPLYALARATPANAPKAAPATSPLALGEDGPGSPFAADRAAPAMPAPSVADVLADPLVAELDRELRAEGFLISPQVAEWQAHTGYGVAILPFDDARTPHPHAFIDAQWVNSFRMAAVVVWDGQKATLVVDSRLGRDASLRPTLMHEARIAGHDEVRLRIFDTVVGQTAQRDVTVLMRDALGFSPVSDEQLAKMDVSWSCVRGCLKDGGLRIGIGAAICLVACAAVYGIGAVISGSADITIFLKCLKICTGIVLGGLATSVKNCLDDC